MSIMEEEDPLKEMTTLLLAGGKMLSKHCPTCGSPLFKVKGKVICPRCSKQVVSDEKKGETRPLDRIVSYKINELVARLEATTDPHEISELLIGINAGLEILSRRKEGGN